MDDNQARSTWFDRVNAWLTMGAAVVLVFMMVFVCTGVLLRYVFNAPIAGTNEVLELSSAVFVMLALPYCTRQDAHIRIDLIDGVLGPKGLMFTEVLYRVLGIAVLWLMVKSNVAKMLDAFEFDDTTNMMQLPLWPVYGMIVLGMGLYAAILALQLLAMFPTRDAKI